MHTQQRKLPNLFRQFPLFNTVNLESILQSNHQVSEIIHTCLLPDDFASRYGGEEFAILLLERDLETAHATLESIREAVASAAVPEIGSHVVTVSIGLAPLLPSHTKRDWFYATDRMLYEAKKIGKNRTVCNPPDSSSVTFG